MAHERKRKILINKRDIHKQFIQVEAEDAGLAAGCLSLNGMRLYLYLCNNRDGYEFELSPTALANWLGWDAEKQRDNLNKVIREGIRDLIKNNFLEEIVKEKEYQFFEAYEQIGDELSLINKSVTNCSGNSEQNVVNIGDKLSLIF